MIDLQIGISQFARDRHKPGSGKSYFFGSEQQLSELVVLHWDRRQPGYGRSNLDQVVVISLPPDQFVGLTVTVREETVLHSELDRRRPEEEPFIRTMATEIFTKGGSYIPVKPNPCAFAQVVLYSRQTLLDSHETLTDGGVYDWEIVSIAASAIEKEPMHPITMARNFLRKEGGTFAPYSAEQFAEAIWYWKDKCGIMSSNHEQKGLQHHAIDQRD